MLLVSQLMLPILLLKLPEHKPLKLQTLAILLLKPPERKPQRLQTPATSLLKSPEHKLAEAANATSITNESTRAQAAEAQNASDIATEITRAQAAEAANQSDIAANATEISSLQTQTGSLAADGQSASFSGNVSAADVTVSGNLTVNGTTTTIDTTNVEVKDSIMNISKGASNAANASNDGGFVVERGSSENNTAFFWDEGADRFRAVSTSATAAVSDIDAADSSMSYVNMQVSDLYLGTDNLGSLSDFTTALNAWGRATTLV